MSGGKIVSLILPLMLMPQLLILAGKREVIRGRLENSVTKEAVSDAMVSGIKENRIIGYCFSDAMGHFELTTDADSLKINISHYASMELFCFFKTIIIITVFAGACFAFVIILQKIISGSLSNTFYTQKGKIEYAFRVLRLYYETRNSP